MIKHTITGNADVTPELSTFISNLANAIPREARAMMDESVPSGRIYRRGLMTGRTSKRLEKMGLRRKLSTKTRIFTGQRFHRAAAKGQPPAKDSGRFYKRIRVTGKGKFEKNVVFDAPYAGYVEDIRPFLDKAIGRAIGSV